MKGVLAVCNLRLTLAAKKKRSYTVTYVLILMMHVINAVQVRLGLKDLVVRLGLKDLMVRLGLKDLVVLVMAESLLGTSVLGAT